MESTSLLYLQITKSLKHQIETGVLKEYDKLPSLRKICIDYDVSMNTAIRAYEELDRDGYIESIPKSGYFVHRRNHRFRSIPSVTNPELFTKNDNQEGVVTTMVKNFDNATIHLSSANLGPELVPIKKVNKALLAATQTLSDSGTIYRRQGSLKLKIEIAKRTYGWGGNLKDSDIVPTSGSMDAIAFCLLALTKAGDTIVVESPCYFGILRLANSMGLMVVELPTHPITGLEIDAFRLLISKRKVAACVVVTNFSNPLGSCMPTENKKELVRLVTLHDIPLIEDDLYGDLYFEHTRPKSCKAFDEAGMVLWCGSFSKTLVSGYRVGWVAPGKFKDQIERIKLYYTLQSSVITHEAVGNFMESGAYEKHLNTLRPILRDNCYQFQKTIHEYFPAHARVSQPLGGMNLWIEFAPGFNALELYNKAIEKGLSITPGRAYTLQNQYLNCMKLSFGLKWDTKMERALKLLGKLANE